MGQCDGTLHCPQTPGMGPSDGPPGLGPHHVTVNLSVSVRYVRRIVAERRIPYVKVGHLIRFQRDEVQRWVDANRVDALTGRR